MKYKPDDIILVDWDGVRSFERITEIVDEKIFAKLLCDFYYRSGVVSDIEIYEDFGEELLTGGTIIDKWTKNEMSVFLTLET